MRASADTWLVTGGAGFIGTNLVRQLLADGVAVVNYDNLSYAGRAENLADVADHPGYAFVRGDICDAARIAATLREHRPQVIIHLAAHTHVDRSIDDPDAFVRTNIVGTHTLVEAARAWWDGLTGAARARFRFVHVSTDEVYGSLGPRGRFTEASAYAPSSPYAASKASADHLALASHITHGFPVVVSHASNNVGPYQFPEKLIPVVILSALDRREIPVYGDGGQVRDWISVHDHCAALRLLATRGVPGQRYNVGGGNERANLALVREICAIVDAVAPGRSPSADLIRMVEDRPGHDRRYALDASKIQRELGWSPRIALDRALRDTVAWYVEHRAWCRPVERDGLRRRGLPRRGAPPGDTCT